MDIGTVESKTSKYIDLKHKSEHKVNRLPGLAIHNLREKIQPEMINLDDLISHKKEEQADEASNSYTVYEGKSKYPLTLTWFPNILCFKLDEKPVTGKLWIWNMTPRPIYLHYCRLWNNVTSYGVRLHCSPRTRFWLSPGLKCEITIQATPGTWCPVPSAVFFMQIAAQHMRDSVTGYFKIPIKTIFLKYEPPVCTEHSV